MANDPRTFLIKPCGQSNAKIVSSTSDRKNFFNSLGKVGDIEALNNIAGGKIALGLRTLTKTSNSIRTGALSPDSSAVPQNGTQVLDEVGISQQATEQAGTFNPGVVNRALAQGDVIADKIKAGDYNLEDIPSGVQDITNLSQLISGIYTPGVDELSNRDLEICGASPFAMDLIYYAPKQKFLFVMEFEFSSDFQALDSLPPAYMVKNTTRPNINFEHEEVNMYNFWVRVPKRTSYEPMSMRFYDDNKNGAMGLYDSYLKAVSPIANLSFGDQKMEDLDGAFEAQSMNFANPARNLGTGEIFGKDGAALVHEYAASFGPLSTSGTTKNVFKRITLYHVYDYGRLMNSYVFFNPKILNMELDELDMAESGNGNEVTMQFAYDAVNITTGVRVSEHKEKLDSLTRIRDYALNPQFKGDVEAINATDDGKPPGDMAAGGGFAEDVGLAVNAATGAINSAFTSVSNAIGTGVDAATETIGSGLDAASASVKSALTNASAENASRGNSDNSDII